MIFIKLWIDDVRPAPEGYLWCKSVNEAIRKICAAEMPYASNWMDHISDTDIISIINIDHDAGDYASDGGDYIKLLDWLEETGRNYPIRIHTQNVVGRMNMEAICKKNNWTIVE